MEELMETIGIVAALDEQIDRLQQARNLLAGQRAGNGRIKTRGGRETGNGPVTRNRVMSPEARKRIGDAQKKRWAAQRKAAR
jgi:hypothetical protein